MALYYYLVITRHAPVVGLFLKVLSIEISKKKEKPLFDNIQKLTL